DVDDDVPAGTGARRPRPVEEGTQAPVSGRRRPPRKSCDAVRTGLKGHKSREDPAVERKEAVDANLYAACGGRGHAYLDVRCLTRTQSDRPASGDESLRLRDLANQQGETVR